MSAKSIRFLTALAGACTTMWILSENVSFVDYPLDCWSAGALLDTPLEPYPATVEMREMIDLTPDRSYVVDEFTNRQPTEED